MLSVVSDLKGVAGIVGGEKRDAYERFARTLLLVVMLMPLALTLGMGPPVGFWSLSFKEAARSLSSASQSRQRRAAQRSIRWAARMDTFV
jgi:hypothetical protein